MHPRSSKKDHSLLSGSKKLMHTTSQTCFTHHMVHQNILQVKLVTSLCCQDSQHHHIVLKGQLLTSSFQNQLDKLVSVFLQQVEVTFPCFINLLLDLCHPLIRGHGNCLIQSASHVLSSSLIHEVLFGSVEFHFKQFLQACQKGPVGQSVSSAHIHGRTSWSRCLLNKLKKMIAGKFESRKDRQWCWFQVQAGVRFWERLEKSFEVATSKDFR